MRPPRPEELVTAMTRKPDVTSSLARRLFSFSFAALLYLASDDIALAKRELTHLLH